jgi:hypothetical protein
VAGRRHEAGAGQQLELAADRQVLDAGRIDPLGEV